MMETNKKKIIKECEFCNTDATSLCFKCKNYYCEKCFKYIHDKQKNINHKKENIDPFIPIDLKCPEHPEHPIYLFCADDERICCTCCLYKNLHNNHKIIELSDIKSLEKENLTIESKMNEFNGTLKKLMELKHKIESEINEINSLFDKVMENLKQSYLKKHEQLIKEENDLKEKLENEVTKTKEQLELFLSQTNNEIKISERINKGVNKIKNEEKNIIKNLSYISKINENNKSIKKLLQQLLKNIKIAYDEEKSIINYKEYYFNGISKPKNIEVKDITFSSFNVLWDADNLQFNNNNKYRVEIRKKDEIFTKVYEGTDKYCLINGLNKNTDYEIRICLIYNNIMGEWTEIQKIKTKMIIDSNILSKSNKEKEFIEKIKEWTGYKSLELIYRGTRDGMTCTDYHNKCDNFGKLLILLENDKNHIFGGYASLSWNIGQCNYQNAANSFLFSLTNIYNSEPIKFPCKNDNQALYYRNDFGPLFGGSGNDLGLYENFTKDGGFSSRFPNTYSDILGKGKSVFTGDNNSSTFKIKEIEVFRMK